MLTPATFAHTALSTTASASSSLGLLVPSLSGPIASSTSTSAGATTTTMVSTFANLAEAAAASTASPTVAAASTTALSAVAPVVVDACAAAAPFASILLFTAPWTTIGNIVQERTVGKLPLLPYSSMVASAFIWTVYGLLIRNPKIWSANGVGLLFGLYYMTQFIRFSVVGGKQQPTADAKSDLASSFASSDEQQQLQVSSSPSLPASVKGHIATVIAIATTTLSIAAAGIGLGRNRASSLIVGAIGTVLTIAMFGSPLSTLKTVIDEQDASTIPLPFTIASWINCLCWTVTGLFYIKPQFDLNVIIPNSLGLVFSTLQVVLKLMYRGGPNEDEPAAIDGTNTDYVRYNSNNNNKQYATDLPM